jgi:hypothetical protein
MVVKLRNRKFYIDLSLILNASLLKNDAKKYEDIIAFVKMGRFVPRQTTIYANFIGRNIQ